jgi:multiple sugar transport system substrate-binding protein
MKIDRRRLLQLMGSAAAAAPFGISAGTALGQELRQFPGVTLSVLASSGHRQFNPVWDKLPEFEKATGIKVSLTRVPTGEIRQKIMQDLAMGSGQFDVLEILDDTIYSASQYLSNLQPFVEKDYGSVDAWWEPQVEWARKAASITGELRGYPFYAGTVGGAYRADLFDDAGNKTGFKEKFGYDLPAPPKTWAELVDVATFFTRQENGQQHWGLVMPGKEDPGMDVMENFLFNEGVTHLDTENRSNWGAAHPENFATVEKVAGFLKGLVFDKKVVPPTITGMATNECVDFYLNGSAAMILDLTYFAWDEMVSEAVVSRIGQSVSFEAPASEGKGAGGIPFYWMYGISERSGAKDAGWEFLRWFMTEDNLKLALTEGIGVFVPTDKRIANWAAEQNRLPPAIVPAIEHAQVYQLNPQIGQVRQLVRKYTELLYLDQLTPEQFREQSAKEIDDLMVASGLVKG